MRFILNLKQLNRFIVTDHFKLEDFRTAIKLVTRNCYMSTIDIKDAYFFVKVGNKSRKYLRFVWNDQLYEFNVLPFGLCTAPFVFTKIMKPVVKLLRSCGFLSTIYLDDLFLIGSSYRECLTNIWYSEALLTALGFVINKEKSSLIPKRSCRFLGYVINSEKFQVSLPQEKTERSQKVVETFFNKKRCKIREFAKLIGLLTSSCPAVEYGWLYTKSFERYKFLNLLENNLNFDSYMTVPEIIQDDLHWWHKALKNPVNKIKEEEYCLEIFTDSSTTGWGAACGEETASGPWSCKERSHHINYLEILAAFFGLKTFATNMRCCQILLRVDNTTAISYINRMGGVQFPHLTQVTKMLWQWCEVRQIHVFASYIRSCDNVVADAESRRNHPDIEWELSGDAFQNIVQNFGKPDIDIFASRLNRKCNKYISWYRDPDAYCINAFTISWSNFYFYAFPPFSVILKTIRKIINDKATGILVVPQWPTQAWYPLFQQLLTSQPIILKPSKNLILSRSSKRNLHQQLTLVAGVLSGRR